MIATLTLSRVTRIGSGRFAPLRSETWKGSARSGWSLRMQARVSWLSDATLKELPAAKPLLRAPRRAMRFVRLLLRAGRASSSEVIDKSTAPS